MDTITIKQVREVLREFCKNKKQTNVATEFGISQQYLSLMMNGTRPVSTKIAAKIGYKRIVVYIKSEDSAQDK